MHGKMGVSQRRQINPLHLLQQQRNVVNTLRNDGRYCMHAQSLAQSPIYLQIWANGEEFGKTLKKKTVGVMDNASVHTREEFEECLPRWKKQG
jgi:hypothetical protein